MMMAIYLCLARNPWNGEELTPREETGILLEIVGGNRMTETGSYTAGDETGG